MNLKKKMALIAVELVEESGGERDEKIVRDLASWFREETTLVPWVKAVKDIAVKDC